MLPDQKLASVVREATVLIVLEDTERERVEVEGDVLNEPGNSVVPYFTTETF